MDVRLGPCLLPFITLISIGVLPVSGSLCQKNCSASIRKDLGIPIGESVNIFHDYGFLSYSIHVAPVQSSSLEPHKLFRTVTNTVLDEQLYQLNIKRNSRSLVERHFELHLCDSVESLIANYLHKFTIEGLHKPWKAFTASWRKHLLPRMFGIPATYLTDEFRFLLVRIEKRSTTASVSGQTKLTTQLVEEVGKLSEGNLRHIIDFFISHGTHVIDRYITGDAIYQVLVYQPADYSQLQSRLGDFNINNATRANFIFLFPSPPTYVGKLQLASGNRTIVQWLESRLALSLLPRILPSGIRLMAAPVLLTHIYRQLRERAVLGLDLMAISRTIQDPIRRDWLHETLINLLRMWEYNM